MSYHSIIGIEVHIQLNTNTKLFCRCLNEYAPDSPNKNICPFCTGQPGALPVLNKEAVKKAIQFGVAVKAKIPCKTRWDRKNYFYPDLPAGYQISQYDNPIVEGGEIEFFLEKEGQNPTKKIVALTRAHLEADAGKLLHLEDKTLVDFNRSGCPLIEVVTEPVIRSSSEAMAFVSELQLLARTLGISDADMEKGQMRFDCNLSLQNEEEYQNQKLPKYKVEIKNINSIRALGRSIEYEIQRQTTLLEKNEKPIQETRGWRDDLNKSVSQRSKEDADDYRYFPEPDLQVLLIKNTDIPNLSDLPILPNEKREKYLNIGINLQIANLFITQPLVGNYFDEIYNNSDISSKPQELKTLANIIATNLQSFSLKNQIQIDKILTKEQLLDLNKFFTKKDINNLTVIKVIEELAGKNQVNIENYLKENNLLQIADTQELTKIVENVISNNPKPVEQYKQGKVQVIGFLVGQCMKESQGKGNPALFKEILEQKLS